MTANQRNKTKALALWAALDSDPARARALLASVERWQAPEPIGVQTNGAAVLDTLFGPLHQAIPDLTRETHVFMAGKSSAREGGAGDGERWVAGCGYYSGRAKAQVFGIPATDRDLQIRWGEFLCFDAAGNITRAQTIWDFVDWFDQIGLSVLPHPRGVPHVFPAPTDYEGVLMSEQSERASATTLDLGRDLIFGGLNKFDESDLGSMGMAGFFHPEIKWYGPGGIGACLSLEAFETCHQRPWLTAFPDRKVMHLESLFAEDRMLAASGPRGVIATHNGPYLDHPATGLPIEVSGLDFWLRKERQFTENWVFVDMVHLFAQIGVDLFGRMMAMQK